MYDLEFIEVWKFCIVACNDKWFKVFIWVWFELLMSVVETCRKLLWVVKIMHVQY
jgi:hypothetical protein